MRSDLAPAIGQIPDTICNRVDHHRIAITVDLKLSMIVIREQWQCEKGLAMFAEVRRYISDPQPAARRSTFSIPLPDLCPDVRHVESISFEVFAMDRGSAVAWAKVGHEEQVAVQLRIIGPKLKASAVMVHGLVNLPGIAEGHAEVVVCRR